MSPPSHHCGWGSYGFPDGLHGVDSATWPSIWTFVDVGTPGLALAAVAVLLWCFSPSNPKLVRCARDTMREPCAVRPGARAGEEGRKAGKQGEHARQGQRHMLATYRMRMLTQGSSVAGGRQTPQLPAAR